MSGQRTSTSASKEDQGWAGDMEGAGENEEGSKEGRTMPGRG